MKEIIESSKDIRLRQKWTLNSKCVVFSRSKKQWSTGVIVDVIVDDTSNMEWLTVQYDGTKRKRIQRFSECIKPANLDNDYQVDHKLNKLMLKQLKLKENAEAEKITFPCDLIMMPGGNPITRSKEGHILLNTIDCELLVCGYIRRIDNEFGDDINIADDLYTECWNLFQIICKGYIKETFPTGVFYRGYECAIDKLRLKSENSRQLISLYYQYQFESKKESKTKYQ